MKKLPPEEALRRKKERDAKYYQKNKQRIKARTALRYFNTIDEQKAYFHDYHKKNASKKRSITAEWKKKNKHKVNEQVRRRQAAEIYATPKWLAQDHIEKIQEIYWLAHDLRAVSGEEYHVDHIIPLRGKNICGLHVPWNLQILPADLNLSKGANYEP